MYSDTILEIGLGESSLFTFSLISIDLTHRSRGGIYKLNAKVERAD